MITWLLSSLPPNLSNVPPSKPSYAIPFYLKSIFFLITYVHKYISTTNGDHFKTTTGHNSEITLNLKIQVPHEVAVQLWHSYSWIMWGKWYLKIQKQGWKQPCRCETKHMSWREFSWVFENPTDSMFIFYFFLLWSFPSN